MARVRQKLETQAHPEGQHVPNLVDPVGELVKAVVKDLLIYLPWLIGPTKGQGSKKSLLSAAASLTPAELEQRLTATVTEALTRELHATTPEATKLRMGLIAQLATFELDAEVPDVSKVSGVVGKKASTKKSTADKSARVKQPKSKSKQKA